MIRLLVRRYITNEQRIAERKRGVTEDDCNEIKQDISALRFELIELMGRRNNNSAGNSGNSGNTNTGRPMGRGTGMMHDSSLGNSGANSIITSSNETHQSSSTHPNNSLFIGSQPQLNQSDSVQRCGCVDALGVDCANSNRNTLCGCVSGLTHHTALPATQLCSGKRDRQKERRLMKGFDFNSLYLDSTTSVDEDCAMLLQGLSASERQQLLTSNALLLGSTGTLGPSKSKSPNRNRFIRLARGIASKRNRPISTLLSPVSGSAGAATVVRSPLMAANAVGNNKWKQLIEATRSKVKPFSRSSESVNSDLNLQSALANGKFCF